jgi:hypothetical protein
MSIKIYQEELDKIINLLGRIAIGNGDAQNFYQGLIRSANLPENWEIEILQKQGLNNSKIIYWALDKGKNTQDERYHTLGSILTILLKETGDREEIATFMVRYELCDINLLPPELQIKIDVLAINKQKLEYAIISKKAQDDLDSILQAIDFSIVKNACRRSLPRLAHHHALSIEGLDRVFKLLLVEFPYRNDGERRILEFVWRLREDYRIQSQQIHLKLDDWFDLYGLKSPSIDRRDSENIPQPRLFIQVAPKHSEVNQFCVQAWLIPDRAWLISDVNLLKKTYAEHEYFYLDFCYLLSDYRQELHDSISPELSKKIEQISKSKSLEGTEKDREIKYIRDLSFSKEELKELLCLFLNESLLILYYEQVEVTERIDLCELTIEVFLPPELLGDCDLDQWSFYDIAEEINLDAVGSSYRILIRSLERSKWLQPLETSDIRSLRKNATKKKAWQDKWALVYSKCQEGAIPTDLEFPLLSHTNDFDKAILDQKIGIKLVQESGRDEILKVIIEEKGIPIVLWTRFSNSEVDFEPGWRELVHTEPLHDLPQSVRMSRKAAQESGCPNHLGSNLVFLWDDPNSLSPPEGDFLRVDNSSKKQ